MFIIRFVAWVISVGAGLLALDWALPAYNLRAISTLKCYLNPAHTQDIHRIVQASSVVLLFFCVVQLIRFLTPKRRQTSISFENDKGQIIVNLASIEDALIREGKNDSDVKSIKVGFAGRGKKLRIKVSVVLWEMANVPEKIGTLQALLEVRFRDIMGTAAETMKIDVALKKLEPRATAKKADESVPIANTGGFHGEMEYPAPIKEEDGEKTD